jgi:competence ComEA-like helix-hairpin-helix protein
MTGNNSEDNFFSYSKSEIRGFIVLCLLIALLLIFRYIQHRQVGEFEIVDTAMQDSSGMPGIESHAKDKFRPRDEIPGRAVFLDDPVDPNIAGYDRLVDAGLPSRAATNLIRYREKGGSFRSAEDLYRIYGMDSVRLSSILHNFKFPAASAMTNDMMRSRKKENERIEINSADTAELKKLPGIGSVLSARIIKYRNLLGGFYSVQQLTEVYGIDDSLQEVLAQCILIDTLCIKKINLNRTSLEQLQKHPYLDPYQAKSILTYRELMGSFTSPNQLILNYLISEENYYRIAPYLCAEGQ